MIKKFIAGFLFLIITVNSVYAQESITPAMSVIPKPTIEYKLPFPGIMPDHPFFKLKKIRDNIVIFVTRNYSKKSALYLLLGDKWLVMGNNYCFKQKYEDAANAFDEAERYYQKAVTTLFEIKEKSKPELGYADKLKVAGEKHKEIISSCGSNEMDAGLREKFSEILSINNGAYQQLPFLK